MAADAKQPQQGSGQAQTQAQGPKVKATYHLSLVTSVEDGLKMHSLILTEMLADRINRRVVVQPRIERDLQEAMDHLQRTAMRVFYFGEGESYFP